MKVPLLPTAVLISGSGRSLQNLLRQSKREDLPIDVRLVISSTSKAEGLRFAEEYGVTSLVVPRSGYTSDKEYSETIFDAIRAAKVEVVVLAGYLKLLVIPNDFENRVLNIHPALLPKFGGQGMFGHHVHEAVIASGEKESGCTVHFADNEYDNGPILHQERVPVLPEDTAETLAARVFEAELKAYPHVLKELAKKKIK